MFKHKLLLKIKDQLRGQDIIYNLFLMQKQALLLGMLLLWTVSCALLQRASRDLGITEPGPQVGKILPYSAIEN